MSDKGLFAVRHEKFIIDGLDALYDGNFFTEAATDIAFKTFVPVIDDNFIDKLIVKAKFSPEDIGKLRAIMDSALDKNYDQAGDLLAEFMDSKINVPLLDDTSEAIFFKSVVGLIVSAIMAKIEKDSQPPKPTDPNGGEN